MATIRDQIEGSLRLLEVLGAGEPALAEDATDALQAMNDMIDSWSITPGNVYTQAIETFTLTAGVDSYTIGSGGTFNTTIPTEIKAISITLGNSVTSTLAQISAAEYAALDDKFISMLPDRYYYKYDEPLGTLYFYHKPPDAYTIKIYSNKALTTYSNLDDELIMPKGWKRALRYNLAREIAPEYGKALTPEAAAIAVESMTAIQAQIGNLTDSQLAVDDALTSRGQYYILGKI